MENEGFQILKGSWNSFPCFSRTRESQFFIQSLNVNVSIFISSSLNVEFRNCYCTTWRRKKSASKWKWHLSNDGKDVKLQKRLHFECKQIWKHKSFMFSRANEDLRNRKFFEWMEKLQTQRSQLSFTIFIAAVDAFCSFLRYGKLYTFIEKQKEIVENGNYFITLLLTLILSVWYTAISQTSSWCRYYSHSSSNVTTRLRCWEFDHSTECQQIWGENQPQNRLESQFSFTNIINK